ncbi:PAS domain-containing protein [Methanoculleus caldifontis]|nr:PAS domain-containing protein [Methanoculleus sp. Wushi-C6]
MDCNRTGSRKSELEQVAGILLYYDSCCAQGKSRVAAGSVRDLLALLLERLDDGIVVIGPDQTVAWVNDAMEGLFGVSRYETIGMNAVEFVSRCISPCLLEGETLKEDFIVSCFFDEAIPARRYCIARTRERRVWVEYSSTVIPDGPGRGARLDTYHISPDCSRGEAGLQDCRRLYGVLAAVSSDPVISLDPDLMIMSASPPVRHLLGYDPDSLPGLHLSSIMASDSVVEFQKACFRGRASDGEMGLERPAGDMRSMEVTFLDAQNRPVAAVVAFLPVDDGEGGFAGIVAAVHDGAGGDLRHGVCAQLDENIEHLACLGDRIKNPLAVILGLAGLEDGEVARKIADQARIIDGVLTELDRGYVASLSVREFLRKHYGLKGDDRPGASDDSSIDRR